MSKPLYQCLVFGNPSDEQLTAFAASFGDALNHFGLKAGTDFAITKGITADFVETVPTVAAKHSYRSSGEFAEERQC